MLHFTPWAKVGQTFEIEQEVGGYKIVTKYECIESDEYSCKCKIVEVTLSTAWADYDSGA